MAEQDKEQQTEEATPRKKEKLREDGKVIKSQDVGGAAVLAAVAGTLSVTGHGAAIDMLELSQRAFRFSDVGQPLAAVGSVLPVLTSAVLPVIIVAGIAAAAAGMIQTKGLFSLKLLELKPERLNPIPNLKNVFPSKESLLELFKNLVKISAVGVVVYRVIADASPEFAVLPSSPPTVAAATVGAVATKVALHGSIAFAVVAAFDYWLARRRYNEEAKMSKQDIRDEHKDQEGRPEVKARQRQRMREASKRRAVSDVKQATVLVCNPTHISIALRYDPDKDGAPMMLAKGVDEVALRMRTEARKHGIPAVENRPLARALYADGKIGRPIPVGLYQAAAEIIAHVMRIKGAMA